MKLLYLSVAIVIIIVAVFFVRNLYNTNPELPPYGLKSCEEIFSMNGTRMLFSGNCATSYTIKVDDSTQLELNYYEQEDQGLVIPVMDCQSNIEMLSLGANFAVAEEAGFATIIVAEKQNKGEYACEINLVDEYSKPVLSQSLHLTVVVE